MLTEAIEALDIQPNQWYIDATFGHGGHTQAILDQGGRVLALDFDHAAIERGQDQFSTELDQDKLVLHRTNFDQLQTVLNQTNLNQPIAGILFDFGTNLEQLTDLPRGLSFQAADEELDMRLDQRLGVKAKDLLAVMGQKQLQQVFSVFGGEREAKRISTQIVKLRNEGQLITTVGELVELIEQTKRHHPHKIHPATKVFQALRIAVNDELGNIDRALPQALEILQPRGKIVTIAFHQGEDRAVKQYFKNWEENQRGQRTPKQVLIPSTAEKERNLKSRSAKMRIFTKHHES